MSKDSEVKILMRKFVDGEVTLSDLSDRVVPEFWGEDAPQAVHDLDLLLAEVSGGHRTESELRDELISIVGSGRVKATSVASVPLSQSNVGSYASFDVDIQVPANLPLHHRTGATGRGAPA